MPTPSERKALLFLALVACLGTGVRWLRLGADGAETPETRDALARQIEAVDSRATKGQRSSAGAPKAGAAARGGRAGASATPAGRAAPGTRVDVDRASAQELEELPRIGPALAARIIADRDSLGPYGGLENLQRVKGIGPGIARQLAPLVTFSGTPRQPFAGKNVR